MRYAFKIFVFVLFLVSNFNAQDLSREQKLQKIAELNNQIKTLEKDIILPGAKDLEQAQKQGLNVFRIMPREIYDGVLTIRGGAAYYSFTKKEHSYNSIPQIQLSQKSLSVGFAGADYGFITDLGEISLGDISRENNEISFLANYKPPTAQEEARIEHQKIGRGFDIDGINYNSRAAAIVVHSYILRAITFEEADTLVAFKINRKDTDGSLIIFWKLLETFEIPHLERNKITSIIPQVSANEAEVSDYVITQVLQTEFMQKGLNNISVDATTTEVVLRGTVPKGEMVETVRIAHETAKRKIKNQLTEQ